LIQESGNIESVGIRSRIAKNLGTEFKRPFNEDHIITRVEVNWSQFVAIIAPRDEPGLLHVVMARPLAIVASGWRMLFEKLPWFLKPQASLWAHHAERDGYILDVERLPSHQ